MEQGSIPVLAKKMWQMVRVILLMLRKGISKWPKLMLGLNMTMKGRKVAGKAFLHNLMFHHHHHHHSAARPHDGGRLDYEFSCSSSDAAKRPRHRNSSQYFFPCSHAPPTHDELGLAPDPNAFRRELEMLAAGKGEASPEISPFLQSPAVSELIYSELSSPALPGFGRTPLARQLRVTDSPFPLRDADEGDMGVDEAAAAFIMKFYNELRKENKRALR